MSNPKMIAALVGLILCVLMVCAYPVNYIALTLTLLLVIGVVCYYGILLYKMSECHTSGERVKLLARVKPGVNFSNAFLPFSVIGLIIYVAVS